MQQFPSAISEPFTQWPQTYHVTGGTRLPECWRPQTGASAGKETRYQGRAWGHLFKLQYEAVDYNRICPFLNSVKGFPLFGIFIKSTNTRDTSTGLIQILIIYIQVVGSIVIIQELR